MPVLSAAVQQRLFILGERAHLSCILFKRKDPPRLFDCQSWRTFTAAMMCATGLLENAPETHRALITIATNQRSRKVTRRATKSISRIVEKHIAPHCIGYVWFFHRTVEGFIHWHVAAHMKDPIVPANCDGPAVRLFLRSIPVAGRRSARPDTVLTRGAKTIRKATSDACRRAGLGHVVDVDVIDSIDHVVPYLARYLRGVAEIGRRYYADHRVRLWGASKSARIANASQCLVTEGRLARMKRAAWHLVHGFRTAAQAKAHLGCRYAYHSRESMWSLRLLVYPTETDFFKDWGCRLSPEALGVIVLSPDYSPTARSRIYDHDICSIEVADEVAFLRKRACLTSG